MSSEPSDAETVLMTGASAGIGRELCRLFAADGSRLILVARREDRLHRLAAELRSAYGTTSVVLPCDLSRSDSADELCEQLQQRGTAVDVLVNNAGTGLRERFLDCPVGVEADMIQLNVLTPTRLARSLLPGMVQRGHGGLLNVASLAAFQPGPNMAVYAATKAYMLLWTEALAVELRGTGVQITLLAPGPTATELPQTSSFAATRLYRYGAMDPQTVALAGYRGFRKNRRLVEPGLRNKLRAFVVRVLPRNAMRRIVGWLNTPPSQ